LYFLFMMLPPPRSPLFPYTTLFRSRDGPFKHLHGRWQFHALDESACKVTLTLDFEPTSRLLLPAMALGFQALADRMVDDFVRVRSEEHTSELQSRENLVCRLLLEKK